MAFTVCIFHYLIYYLLEIIFVTVSTLLVMFILTYKFINGKKKYENICVNWRKKIDDWNIVSELTQVSWRLQVDDKCNVQYSVDSCYITFLRTCEITLFIKILFDQGCKDTKETFNLGLKKHLL